MLHEEVLSQNMILWLLPQKVLIYKVMQKQVLTLIFACSRMVSILLLRMLKLVIRHFITCSVPKHTILCTIRGSDGCSVYTYVLERLTSDVTIIMWQSWIEIILSCISSASLSLTHCSASWASAKGRVHVRCINMWISDISSKCVWAPL